MKVKANYGINCDKGYFESGEVFEIEADDLRIYGDAVTVVEDGKTDAADARNAAGDPSVPDKPEQEEMAAQSEETAESEKPKAARSRARTRKA